MDELPPARKSQELVLFNEKSSLESAATAQNVVKGTSGEYRWRFRPKSGRKNASHSPIARLRNSPVTYVQDCRHGDDGVLRRPTGGPRVRALQTFVRSAG